MDTLKEITKLAESLKVKTCTKCGKTKHYGESYFDKTWCQKCMREYQKKYRKEKREALSISEKEEINRKRRDDYHRNDKLKEANKEYYKKNKTIIAKKQKEYSKKNAIKLREKSRRWRENHKEEAKSRESMWRSKNKERCVSNNAKWRRKNKERCFQYGVNYRKANKDKLIQIKKESGILERKNLDDVYCIKRIKSESGLNAEDITPEMIEIKRAQITLKRLTR